MHLVLLAGLAGYFLHASWRRWPDLIVDSGRELYIAWRLAEGAVLFREVDNFYGPLSQYFNACLFKLFGPGLMVLAIANIVILAAILVSAYFLFRAAWNAVAALVAVTIFIAIFCFSRFTVEGSFNYIFPYAHETTHGMLVLLLLVAVLRRWCDAPSLKRSSLGGILFGIALVLKPEIIFSAAVVTVCAATMAWRRIPGAKLRHAGVWGASALMPTALFTAYFSQSFTMKAAWAAASRAWLSVIGTTRFVSDPVQLRYMGLDAPAKHLVEHTTATVIALGLVAAIAGLGWLTTRLHANAFRPIFLGVLALAMGVFSWMQPLERSVQFGRCLLGTVMVYLLFQIVRKVRGGIASDDSHGAEVSRLRILLAVLAATLMARMVLNGRIWQFGYYQAPLAAMVAIAVLMHEVPQWLRVEKFGRTAIIALSLALVLPPVAALSHESVRTNAAVDFPVGAGRDRFFVPSPTVYPVGATAAQLVSQFAEIETDEALLVLPEGLMLNYLTRMRSPLPHFFYYSVVTEHGREKDIVRRLAQDPPKWVIVVDRKLGEYGIRYGERSGGGADLREWVESHYETTGQKDGRVLDLDLDGLIIFARKPR